MKSESESYKAAGVDITAGYEAVKLMQKHIARTKTAGMITDVGGFGGAFALKPGMKEPVLVSGTDGVGTKLKLAFIMDKHDTVGIDCVAMCVNDVVCCGAEPLFFLDYIATGKLEPSRVASIVEGVAEGCVRAGCALIGGETAEMPGFYPDNEYDLAGFSVGAAERAHMLDSSRVRAGDALIALPSSGVHSNGFSLVRRVFNLEQHAGDYIDELGTTLGEALLTPTVIYVKPVLSLMRDIRLHAAAHITGGGFYENIPRSLPDGLCARIDRAALRVPPIFSLIASCGEIPERDMFNTYNMGVGMCLTVAAEDADEAVRILAKAGTDAYAIGEVVPGHDGVLL